MSAGCVSAVARCGTMLNLTSLCVVTACSADLENGQSWNLGVPRGERFVPSLLPISNDRESNLSSAVFQVLPVMVSLVSADNFPSALLFSVFSVYSVNCVFQFPGNLGCHWLTRREEVSVLKWELRISKAGPHFEGGRRSRGG